MACHDGAVNWVPELLDGRLSLLRRLGAGAFGTVYEAVDAKFGGRVAVKVLHPKLAAARGVGATFHYQPLHLSEVGVRAGGKPGDCPVTERAADTLVRLPLYADLTTADVDRVIAAVTAFTP